MTALRMRSLAWLFALSLAGASPVGAHDLSVAHVDIRAAAGGSELEIDLDLALRDIALTLPLDGDRDEQVTWGELQAARGELEQMVAARVQVFDAQGACPLQPVSLAVRRYDDGAYASLAMRARCASGESLRVRYGLLFDSDPQHRALVTVHRGGGVFTAIARVDAPEIAVPTVAGNASSTFTSFLREGVGHILSGYDHLAFVLLLLLPAPLLLVAGRWQPADQWRPVFWHSVGLVTAFTAAHSITLSAAALGWVRPSSFWVEAAIAFSVLLAALNNLRPLVVRRLWAVAFGFGLLHGLGFAGALLETGLPERARLAALLGFNLGVELGQLAVVAVALPVLFLLRRSPRYPDLVLRLLSALVVVLAGWWLVERLRG